MISDNKIMKNCLIPVGNMTEIEHGILETRHENLFENVVLSEKAIIPPKLIIRKNFLKDFEKKRPLQGSPDYTKTMKFNPIEKRNSGERTRITLNELLSVKDNRKLTNTFNKNLNKITNEMNNEDIFQGNSPDSMDINLNKFGGLVHAGLSPFFRPAELVETPKENSDDSFEIPPEQVKEIDNDFFEDNDLLVRATGFQDVWEDEDDEPMRAGGLDDMW